MATGCGRALKMIDWLSSGLLVMSSASSKGDMALSAIDKASTSPSLIKVLMDG